MATSSAATRKKRRVGLVLPLLVLLLAGLLLGRPAVELVLRQTSTPAAYLRHAETRTREDAARAAVLLRRLFPERESAPTQNELSMTLSDTARELLANVKVGPTRLDWVESLGVNACVQTRPEAESAAVLELLLNGTRLLSMETVCDGSAVSLRVPELSDAVLTQPTAFPTQAAALSARQLSTLLGRYHGLALDELTELTRESGILTAGGISARCTVLSAELDENRAKNALLTLLRTAQADSDLLAAVEEAGALRGEEPERFGRAFLDALDRAADSLERNGLPVGSYRAAWYVSPYGRVCGEEFLFTGADGESDSLRLALPRKGGRLGMELSMEINGARIAVEGSWLLRGTSLTGAAALKQNTTALLTVDSTLTLKNRDSGRFSLTLLPTRELLRALPLPEGADSLARALSLRAEAEWSAGSLSSAVSLGHDSEALVTLAFDRRERGEALALTLSGGVEAAEWLRGIKLPGLFSSGSFGTVFDNCRQAGMPGELIAGLKLLLPSLVG